MSSCQRLPQDPALITDEQLLADGELEIKGRILPASNATFLAEVSLADRVDTCVYKPVAGERPLWDFPDGSLASREVAAYAVSESLGWSLVPLTVLRDGPTGHGMVQLWREPDPAQSPVDVVAAGSMPRGFLHVLDALDGQDRTVSLVHEDTAELRRLAVFDVVINNADRKGGHVLPMPDGHRFGVDHGVCFNEEPKLRTVLWGWARKPLLEEHRDAVARLCSDARLRERLDRLLTPLEVQAFEDRCSRLLEADRMPIPSGGWPSIPWPAF